MSWTRYIWPILQSIDIALITATLLLNLFGWFFIKNRFAKYPLLSTYSMLMYGFAALFISSFSYVVLNAQAQFFRLPVLYNTYWFYVLYMLLAIGVALLIAWLIYNAAQKVNRAASFQLINYSMIIIAPALLYVLLIKPFSQNLMAVGLKKVEVFLPANNNEIETIFNPYQFKVLNTKPHGALIPAIPAALFDSLKLVLQNGTHLNIQLNNRINFIQPLKNKNLEQMYVLSMKNYLAVLAVTNAIYGMATLVIIDNSGNLAFLKTYKRGENRLAVHENRKSIIINRQLPDSDVPEFVETIDLP